MIYLLIFGLASGFCETLFAMKSIHVVLVALAVMFVFCVVISLHEAYLMRKRNR